MRQTGLGKWVLYLTVMFVVCVSGCRKQEPAVLGAADIDLMQGTWKGTELGGNGEWLLVITGDQVQADGPGPEDYTGTFVTDETTTPKSALLTIDQCAFEQYVGASSNNIYKLEGDKLTLAGTEPGSDAKPTSFQGGNGTRVFEFTKAEVQ